jgi:hypothetical protein
VPPSGSSHLHGHTAVLELVRAGQIGLFDSTAQCKAAVSCVSGDVLIGEFVHSGGLAGVLDGQADDAPVGVQVEVDVFVEFAGLDRRPVGEFDQGGVGVGKVSDSHSLLLGLVSKVSVEEGVVDGFTVCEQDDAQDAVVHFGDARPASYPPVGLPFFAQGVLDDALDPFVLNDGTVRSPAGVEKVLGVFHRAVLS